MIKDIISRQREKTGAEIYGTETRGMKVQALMWRSCHDGARLDPLPTPLARYTNNFSFSVFPCILFYFTVFPRRKSLFRPLAAIKPKACYAGVFAPAGMGSGPQGHFHRANCLNFRASFAKLCAVPRWLLVSIDAAHFPLTCSLLRALPLVLVYHASPAFPIRL